LSKIKQNFPVRGQDNDSQGFRDNFHNIHEAIKYVNSEVEELSLISVKTNQTSTFYGNTIESANFKNCSTEIWQNDTAELYDITVDYSLGSYQVFQVSSGEHNLDIINWPGEGKSGTIKLSLTPSSSSATAINFPGDYKCVDLNRSTNYDLSAGTNVFEVWSENPLGNAGPVYYVRSIAKLEAENTITQHVDTIYIKNNRFTTGTNDVTVVSSGAYVGNVGLVPSRISTTMTGVVSGTLPHTWFEVSTASNILSNATFCFTNTNTIYTVASVSDNKIYTTGSFEDTNIVFGSPVTFINPVFPNQPVLTTLVNTSATTVTGVISNYKGSIYASASRLEVTYGNYGDGVKNTFAITTMPSTTVTNTSTDLVSAQFVHSVVPAGAVILWYGSIATIPLGWALCNGQTINGYTTPDLRDRFVVGASVDYMPAGGTKDLASTKIMGVYSTATMGGTSATSLVSHMHGGTFSGTVADHTHQITDPGHVHDDGTFRYLLRPPYPGSLTGNDTTGSGSEQAVGPGDGAPMTRATTGITINPATGVAVSGAITAASTGTTDTSHTNIPPFYSLCYIMKVIGV
jgi:hypothetical protein